MNARQVCVREVLDILICMLTLFIACFNCGQCVKKKCKVVKTLTE